MALSPTVKRWGILSSAAVVLIGIAYFLTGHVENVTRLDGPEKIAFEGVLVPGDTRQTSLEGMAAQLKEAQERIERLERVNRDQMRQRTNTVAGQLEKLRRDLLSADDAQKAELLQEIAALEEAQLRAEAGRPTYRNHAAVVEDTDQSSNVSNDLDAAKTLEEAAPAVLRETTPNPEPAIYTALPLDGSHQPRSDEALVEEVFGGPQSSLNISTELASEPRSGGASGGGQIRRVASEPQRETARHGSPGGSEIQIPAGSILTGVLLNGLDAPAGSQSSREPMPVLVRIKHEAILPSHFSADLSECFVLLAVHGELSSERAMMRGEELSCIMADGTVVQEKLAAYAVGEDGRVGLRGRIVSKQGAFLGNAIIVGAMQAAADAVSKGTDVAIGARSGGGLTSSVSVGAGNALDRIAEWYLERADELFPVVEIDPGRRIDLVLTTGMTFRVEL